MDDDALPQDEGGGDDIGVVVLMLGLYLIVLAFFILLNAISEDSPEKRDLVVESVLEGFSFKSEGGLVGDGLDEVVAIPLYRVTEDAIAGVIETYLAFDEFSVTQEGERLTVSMNLERFFRGDDVRLIPEMILFFEDLGGILSSPKKGLRILTEVMIQGEKRVRDNNDDTLITAGQRAALFARALIEQGVMPAHISAASQLGTPQIIMIFDVTVTNFDDAMEATTQLKNVLEGTIDEQESIDAEPLDNQTQGP